MTPYNQPDALKPAQSPWDRQMRADGRAPGVYMVSHESVGTHVGVAGSAYY